MTDADKSDEITLEDIAFAPITQMHGWIANQAISSRRLTEIYLERIARIGPKLECFATVTSDLALVASRCHVPKIKARSFACLREFLCGDDCLMKARF